MFICKYIKLEMVKDTFEQYQKLTKIVNYIFWS